MTPRGPLGAVSAAVTLIAAFAAFAATMALERPARAGDPYLEWYTVRTPHFRVHYHGGLEALAQRTATLAEAIRARITVPLDHPPDDITHILLNDATDSANGSASGVPYNAVRLYVTAPEDLSPLDDYDDWMTELVTHEQTHVFHIDTMSGLPALVNAILGKTYAPNQVQPHWLLEGLAVALESRLTSGGRLRSPIFDMYLRADVLEHHLAGLDEMSHDVRRWPGGDIWYLYGGKFVGWIHDTYGPDVFAAVASDYGANIVPWGLNRAISRATRTAHGPDDRIAYTEGLTYPELYDGWVKSLEEKYGAQADTVRKRGLREGTRLTFSGYSAFSPRFVPACARTGAREELIYHRDDGQSPAGLYRLPLESRSRAALDGVEIVARTSGSPRTASFDPACGMVFDSVAPSLRMHDWDDLFYQPPGTTSGSGRLGSRVRWTTSLRARAPDLSRDGRHVVFATNHAGTTTLRVADVRPEGGITNMRRLVPSMAGDQAFTPRFSPDGTRVAYSAWTKGGYRDVRVVDVETGAFFELSHDRASDTQPTWTPDGRYVLYSSDRTGIANIYAYEMATGIVSQVTNVVNGAFMPEVSPDGRTLVYVGYTSAGFDLFSMPLSTSDWLPATPAPDDRPEPHPEPPHVSWPIEPYDPWPTLRPHNYSLRYSGLGTFGKELTYGVGGSDIVGNHSLSVSLTENLDIGQFTGAVSYSYDRLPFSLSMSGFRSLALRAPVTVDGTSYPVRDEGLGVTSSISYTMLGEFNTQGLSFSYTASNHRATYAIGVLDDPYSDSLSRPGDSFLGSVRFGWHYTNAFRPLYGISSERGFSLNFATDFAGTATGASGTLFAMEGRAVGYLLAPWLSHHVFALALSGGSAGGSFTRRGYYYTGGYAPIDNVFDTITNDLRQGAFVLRGYPPGAFLGRQYNLANLEYRFPIVWVDRGVSTLPAFLHGVSGTLFADYGGAYDALTPNDPLGMYHLGVGGQVSTSFTLGYFLDSSFVIGWAKGLSSGAIPGSQTYLVYAGSF